MEDEKFKDWVGGLPDDAFEYLEWLIDETEHLLDEIVLETTGLKEADEIISRFMKK